MSVLIQKARKGNRDAMQTLYNDNTIREVDKSTESETNDDDSTENETDTESDTNEDATTEGGDNSDMENNTDETENTDSGAVTE